jgi:hypothetical protein
MKLNPSRPVLGGFLHLGCGMTGSGTFYQLRRNGEGEKFSSASLGHSRRGISYR